MKRIIAFLDILFVSILVVACGTPTEEFDRLEWVKSASKLSLYDSSWDRRFVYEGEKLQSYLDEFELCDPQEAQGPKLAISFRKGTLEVEGKAHRTYLYFPKDIRAEAMLKIKRDSEVICLIKRFDE